MLSLEYSRSQPAKQCSACMDPLRKGDGLSVHGRAFLRHEESSPPRTNQNRLPRRTHRTLIRDSRDFRFVHRELLSGALCRPPPESASRGLSQPKAVRLSTIAQVIHRVLVRYFSIRPPGNQSTVQRPINFFFRQTGVQQSGCREQMVVLPLLQMLSGHWGVVGYVSPTSFHAKSQDCSG